MTDEEIGEQIERVRRSAIERNWPESYQDAAMGQKARELIAAEAKPAPTDDAIETFFSGSVRWGVFALPSNRDEVAPFIRGVVAHFAPPAPERAPISEMSVDNIRNAMRDYLNEPLAIDENGTIMGACAYIAHRLAQPAPVVDPDAEAKKLAHILWCKMFPEDASLDPDDIWEKLTARQHNGWRAVAAAKGAGE